MIKQIIKYETSDKREFTSLQEAEKYEMLIHMVKIIIKDLPKRPDGDFNNGYGYIQHDKQKVLMIRTQLIKLAKSYINPWIDQSIESPETPHISYVNRLIGDYPLLYPISKELYRFNCMDSEYREWGQPFYASNPDEANSNVQLNIL